MLHGEAFGLFAGAVALGAVHGVEPGHGWPVAASYALDQANRWLYGFAASLLLGVGHLVSSIAMVGVFFYAKQYFDLVDVNEPIRLGADLSIGGPVSVVAGVLLVALGIREYRHGHAHGGHDADGHDDGDGHGHRSHDAHDHAHGHDHADGHSHDHAEAAEGGVGSRLRRVVPFAGGHGHGHAESRGAEAAADRGLLGIAWFAFLLGFAHEEEFEIIALCAGSSHCLELMGVYAATVIVGIVGLTMLLVAGYEHHEARVRRYTPYLPVLSAVVLVTMGVGFVVGVF